jgi:hypothetical protein
MATIGIFFRLRGKTKTRKTIAALSLAVGQVGIAGGSKIGNIGPMSKAFPPRPRTSGNKSSSSYAIVASKFNEAYVQAMVDHAHTELNSLDPESPVVLLWTPGSFEIPLFVQAAAELKRFNAILALGVAPGEEVSDEDFKTQLEALNEELEKLNAQARELEQTIARNVAGILN